MIKEKDGMNLQVELVEYPSEYDWIAVRKRALVTVGKDSDKAPGESWRKRILKARHSPIRRLFFSFYIECPSYVSVHFVRHIHAQPYVSTQRNDRQDKYDRRKAPQDQPIRMIWDMNGEELITIANKRLCNLADEVTRTVAGMMMEEVLKVCPEFKDELVPMCVRERGCNEMFPCGIRNMEEFMSGVKE